MTVYSHTRLGSFESCPRRYWYGYVGKPPIEKVETVEQFLGQRVHEALEELYRRVMKGRVLAEDELLALFERGWKRNWSDAVRIVRQGETAADYQAVGRKALSDYHRRHAPFDQARTLKVEEKVKVLLDGEGRYRMTGRVDRIAKRADGTFEVHDYKTSGKVPTQATLDRDRQLALYHLGVEQMWQGIERVDLIWHYLRFDMPIVSHRTPEQLDEVKRVCIGLIDEIEARGTVEQEFPTRPSRLCDWCDFRSICPAVRHAVTLEAAGPLAAGADDGLQLVDALAEVDARLKATRQEERDLEARRAALIERLVAWAREHQLEGVTGTEHRVEIRPKEIVEYPKADSDLREAFEAVLREAGVWDDVATLHPGRLASWWAGDLPDAVREALAPFVATRAEFEAKLKPLADSRDDEEE